MSYVKFLGDLRPHSDNGIWSDYAIADVIWNGHKNDTFDGLNHHPAENVILSVRRLADGLYQWEYSLKIAAGVYVRHFDRTVHLEDACRAALAYRPTEYRYDWLEEITWYETEPGRLTAVINGGEATIRRIDALPLIDSETRYNWSRQWAPAAPVLAAISQYDHELSGCADTLELALLAVMEAPGRLTMACAALIATLRKQEPTHA